MATNVELERKKNENNLALLKRFTRRVQEAGVIPKLRSIRYDKRDLSKNTQRVKRLKAIERKEEIDHLIKMGKISQVRSRRRR